MAGGHTGKRGRRFAPFALALASLLLFAATWVPAAGGEWIYLLVTPLFPVLLIALAVERRRSVPLLLRLTLLALGGLLLLSSLGIRLLDAAPAARSFLGLPISAMLLALGLVLFPLLLVGFGFAATFDPAQPPAGGGSCADARDR